MASRQEQKEARRREREAQEEAERRAAARKRRIGIVVGALLAAAAIAAVVLAIAAGGGDGGDGGPSDQASNALKAPTFGVDDLQPAAREAGCELKSPDIAGSTHVEPGTDVEYQTNPPTSGDHEPVPAPDGIYETENPPDVEASVHSLEHGRINIQYAEGAPEQRIRQLEGLFNEELNGVPGYHQLLFRNQTGMDAAVAATAWGQSLTCPDWNDRVFDAIRAFRQQYVDKGPELVP